MINWQVVGQLTALALILASGPIVIILLSTRRNNLL
uniref:Photosystem II reaction center protein Psb30 n=1 Tax=Sciadococcus taiwanensis TaxID=3028030 RepID=A0A9Y1I254_9RHOD|nr:hypothetical protein SCTW_104 [Sciadococcus taiwanensis]